VINNSVAVNPRFTKDNQATSRLSAGVIGGLGIAFIGSFVIASFLPESPLWGMNHLAFVEAPVRYFVIGISVILFLPPVSQMLHGGIRRSLSVLTERSSRGQAIRIVIALASLFLFFALRIETDMYGDTRSLLEYLSKRDLSWDELFDTHDAEPLTRLIHQTFSQWTGYDLRLSYQLISCLAGGIYVWFFLQFLTRLKFNPGLSIIFLLTGLSLGANQLFFGHVEDYTLLYLAVALLLMFAWRYFEGENTLGWVLITFLVGLRLHAEMLLLTPGVIYLAIYHLSLKEKVHSRWVGIRAIWIFFVASLILAVGLYFFYFEAYIIESGNQDYLMKKIFLPMINPIAYLNGYTLQSWMHINDFLQLLLQVGSPTLMFVLVLSLREVRSIRRNQPRIIFFGLCLVYFLMFTFTMNPVLSMPRDWDLLSIVAAPLFFFVIVLYVEVNTSNRTIVFLPLVVSFVLSLTLISSTLFVVNSTKDMVSHRVRALGVWVYHSYHRNSSYLINVGCKNITNLDEQIRERERIIGRIAPDKMEGDPDFSFLHQKLAEAYYLNNDLRNSESNYRKALTEDTTNSEALKGLGVLFLKMGRFEEGIEALDQYNQKFNDPFVQDQWALVAAEYGHYLAFLSESGADSLRIGEVLRSFELISR